MSTVNITPGRIEIRMSPSGASALNDMLALSRDEMTDQMNGSYEGSGFERLVGAVDNMMAGPMLGKPLTDRFVQERGVPVAMGVDSARVVLRAIDMTADAMMKKTGSSDDVLSEDVITMRNVIEGWLETGPDPDTVPMHLRPDPATADIVRRCVEATAARIRKEFGTAFKSVTEEISAKFSGDACDLPASVKPLNPIIVLDHESAEAMLNVIDQSDRTFAQDEKAFDEVSGIAARIRMEMDHEAPSP